MLKTEQNTRAIERLVRRAFLAWHGGRPQFFTTFEHGQWWIERKKDGAQWSVCDADNVNGFVFELVADGQED